ncbi:restriction endonuclease subunit S [Riemerella anatipestifer]|nr:restriction endonuclease subunit S [Riemerella anatipestifer]
MTEKQIITTITAFGFEANPKDTKVYSKTYDKNKYLISVDFIKKRIDFGLEIKKGDDTTSHLENPENIVVLECVDRLLEKGYKPADLTLEKKWKLGRTSKSGKADITVKGKNSKTLLIIECKTWGKEYEKELDNMKSNGGQLFSYYQQDKNTRYLCLYASREHNGKIEKANALIKVEDSTEEKISQQETERLITYEQAKTIKEMLEVWKHKTKGKQTFLNSGLFEPEIEPYNPGYIPIKISDLKDFGKDDKGKVFNQFEEILRHNNISDRSNAFNRIISLILAKIVDENKGEDAITDFQIKEGIDDAESLLERLQSLYSKAMRDYLDEEVIDYKLEDIEAQIANFPRQTAKETLYRIYKELKFYQNNEFAFKEVYNKKLFEENAKVLEEVVRLFQRYRFKYDQKAQFLGDFFELMLESGYKQSEGQFFTPTPIARFIISSIPLKSIVQEKLKRGDKLFLPKVIDFACGSGHFLTEAIEEIANLIKAMDESEIEDEKSIAELKRYKEDMRWAGEYIFGLEKDYRLARTSQVACFMHGDGDANIIFGDGLEKHSRLAKDGTFDVLIANPPYTIKDFKKHLNVNPHDFELWEHITPDSDDIEVFFIERMKQLLRSGGMAGIILPSSILSNAGAYTKAREIILKHFEIKAIVEFGGSTFGATSTNTVTLFLKKRNEDFVTNCQYIAEDFILENREREGDFLNSVELFESYVAQLKLEIEDYKTFIARNPNEAIEETEFYKSYKNWFDGLTEVANLKKRKSFTDLPKADQDAKLKSMFFDLVLEIETEKFFYFLLTHRIEEIPENFAWYDDQTEEGIPLKVAYLQQKVVPQKTLIVKTGNTNKEQEKFLGYKFSNRRGYKGIDFTGDTLMFDPTNPLSSKKVNSYIYKNFNDEKIKVDKELAETLSLVKLTDCINFEKIDFDKRLSLNPNRKIIEFESKFPLRKMDSFCDVKIGGTPNRSEKSYFENGTHLWVSISEMNGDIIIDTKEKLTDEGVANSNVKLIKEGTTLLSFKLSIGKTAIAGADLYTNEAIAGLEIFEDEKENILDKFLYHLFSAKLINLEKDGRNAMGSSLNSKFLKQLKIPVPPIEIQQKIIAEIEAIEAKETKAKKTIEKKKNEIEKIIDAKIFKSNLKEIKIGSLAQTSSGGTPLSRKKEFYENGIIPWINSGEVAQGNIFKTENYITELGLKNSSAKLFPVNTVLLAMYGATAGKVGILRIKAATNQAVCAILPNEKYLPDFLYYQLNTMYDYLLSLRTGVARDNLSQQKIKEIKVRIAPIETQKAIVSEIQKLEKEIQKQEQTIANIEEEKKAVLTKYLEK